MTTAYNAVWCHLIVTGAALTPVQVVATRRKLAQSILASACNGERKPERLKEVALRAYPYIIGNSDLRKPIVNLETVYRKNICSVICSAPSRKTRLLGLVPENLGAVSTFRVPKSGSKKAKVETPYLVRTDVRSGPQKRTSDGTVMSGTSAAAVRSVRILRPASGGEFTSVFQEPLG